MWSKGPFNRSRRPIGNPTSADKASEYPSAPADPARTDKYTKDLPALPNASDSPLHHRPDQLPTLPSTRDGNGEKRYSAVSPVESPVLGPGGRDSGSSFCVSPIDETDQLPRHERKDSQVPALVPAPQSHADADDAPPLPPEPLQPVSKIVQFAPSREQATRWDDFSGEPSNTGRASQVNPRNNSFHKPSGSHASNFLHWGREQFHSKKKLAQARSRISSFSKSEAPAQTETRGRSPSRVFPLGEHSGNRSGTRDASPQVDSFNTLGFVPTVVTTITAGEPKFSPERPATEHDHKGGQRDQPDPKSDAAIDDMMRPEQPASRFGPPNTATEPGSLQDSPNDSPRDSLNLGTKTTDDISSIMSRRRPVPISMPTSQKPVRKPTPAEAVQQPTVAQPPVDDRPKGSESRIASLEGRRDELGRRRRNLETVIKELTRVIQPSSIAYDMAAKAEVKKSVQSIENEIAEIKREEHELGLKVTRAWRRLDEKENNGDGSNLWVKRVTS